MLANSSAPAHQRLSRNATIEGLRGYSALTVIIYHVYNMSISGRFFTPITNPVFVRLWSHLGPFGVELFFIISGYLIIQSLDQHKNIPLFIKNRVFRIYPLFVVLHLIIFTIGPLTNYAWMGSLKHSFARYTFHFFTNLLLLPGVFPLPLAQKNAWSLSYELCFYILAILCYAATSNIKRRFAQSIILSVIAFSLVGLFIYHFPNAAFFLVGTVIYLCRHMISGKNISFISKGYASILFLGASFYFFDAHLLWSLIFSGLFFVSVVREEGVASTILQKRPFQFLGAISYSFYLIHPFALTLMRSIFSHFRAVLPYPYVNLALFGLTGFGSALVISYFAHRYIEIMLTQFLKRRFFQPGKVQGKTA